MLILKPVNFDNIRVKLISRIILVFELHARKWRTLTKTWTSNHLSSKMLDAINYPFPNFNGAAFVVWEWISNCTEYFIMDIITYPCWDLGLTMSVKGPSVSCISIPPGTKNSKRTFIAIAPQCRDTALAKYYSGPYYVTQHSQDYSLALNHRRIAHLTVLQLYLTWLSMFVITFCSLISISRIILLSISQQIVIWTNGGQDFWRHCHQYATVNFRCSCSNRHAYYLVHKSVWSA